MGAHLASTSAEAELDDSDTTGEEEEYTILYPVGSLSAALKEGLFKNCPEPIALQICQEFSGSEERTLSSRVNRSIYAR
jgi:hypothetical protein